MTNPGVASRPALRGGIMAVLLAGGMCLSSPAADPAPTIVVDGGMSVYAGRPWTFRIRIPEGIPLPARIGVSLDVEGRVAQRREAAVAPGAREAAVSMEIPSMRPGVSLPARVRVAVDAGAGAERTVDAAIVLFGPCPFADQTETLKALRIAVWDPPGATIPVLRDAGIPFQTIRSLDAIENDAPGVVVIGEGLDLSAARGLPDALARALARGARVILLAPSAGTLAVPGLGAECASAPHDVRLAREQAVREIDKRLDAGFWLARPGQRGLKASALRGAPVFEISDDRSAWPWLDVRFGAPGGRLVVCAFSLVKDWETGPVSSYLLLGLMQQWSREAAQAKETRP